MSHWNYRVCKINYEAVGMIPAMSEYNIQEVFYDNDNNIQGYCDADFDSDSLEGLKDNLESMLHALDKPVLETKDIANLGEFLNGEFDDEETEPF